ncbi:MAG: HAMP domain-containing protein, partial [Gemmatimonadaceae bacterium]|nr:HAMP domain-containing protein [Gemmatimonadaceae bacterium]
AALAAWRALDRRQAELKALEAEARENLAEVIGDLEAQIENSRAVLVGVSRLVDVGASPARNDSVLRSLFRPTPLRFANVWVIDTTGRNVGALRLPPGGRDSARLSGRPLIAQAMTTGQFTVGTVSRSLVLPGAPFVLSLLLPITSGSPDGRVIGLVGAAIEVDSLDAIRLAPRLPPGSVITVQDTTGRILMRSRDAATWIGREYGATQGFRDVMAVGEGVDKTTSADGITRQIAFRIMRQPRWIVYVGLPEATTIAVVQRQFLFDLAVGLVATLVVLLVAVRQVGRIVEPIEALTRDASAIAGGEEDRRSALDTPDEIGDLARAVNRMAETAVARRRAIEADVARRQAAERALEESRDQLRQAQKMEAMIDTRGRARTCRKCSPPRIGPPT